MADPPNVIVILTDDQGWGDLSLNGNTNLDTPNIDSLARDGVSFERFFVCPVCSPTRAEFLTGRYHPRGGVYSTSAGGERLDLDEATIADSFAAAGYETAAFGKWHNGMQYPYHPNGRGFKEYYGFCSGHWGNYFDPPLDHNGQIVRGDGFAVDDFTNHAMQFIEQNRSRPFFVYLPLNTPHSPMQVPDRWWNKFKDKQLLLHNRQADREKPNHIRAALAMCENVDWNVGRLMKKLDDLDLTDQTIVVYFSDNGPNGYRWNGDMKGRKGSTDEGGVRSPLLIRWPERLPRGKRLQQNGAAIDLLPTLAAMAGIQVVSKKPLDGINLLPAIQGPVDAPADRMIFSHWNGRVSVRNQRFRLDQTGNLYDINADPGQRTDVSASHSEAKQTMQRALSDWKTNVLSELPDEDDRPFLIGHRAYRYTQIPARDGTPHGNIRRSNRFPNCSFFSNWASVDDSITWAAEVASSGDYHVDVHYACPDEDVGATIELSFGDARLTGQVSTPHDPPLRGGEHDRTKRAESYVKDFASMRLGTIHLRQGKGELKLCATKIPSSQVMDFRLLMFTKATESE